MLILIEICTLNSIIGNQKLSDRNFLLQIQILFTVDVVIFAWEKFCENVGKTFLSCRGNFHDTTLISSIKSYGFDGENVRKKRNIA